MRGKGARSGFLTVMSGPSGVGKTTLVADLLGRDPKLRKSISATTRPPREGEIEGQSYFFVDAQGFERLKKGRLIEWARVHGHCYGTPREGVEKFLAQGFDVVLNIDIRGGGQVKKSFPNAVLIFILPPSFEVLRERMLRRGTGDDGDIEVRLENARKEIRAAVHYDYWVVNDDRGEAVAQLKAIIESERCRRNRYPKDFIRTITEAKK